MESNEKYYEDYTYEELVKIGRKIGNKRVRIVMLSIWLFFTCTAVLKIPEMAKQISTLVAAIAIPPCIFTNAINVFMGMLVGKELRDAMLVEQAIKYIELGKVK